jgi:hypothetical protein
MIDYFDDWTGPDWNFDVLDMIDTGAPPSWNPGSYDYDSFGGLDGFDPTSGYTLYDYVDPSTVTGAPGTFNAAKDSQLANEQGGFGPNSDFTGGVSGIPPRGALQQLRDALGGDNWMRNLLAGLTAMGAFTNRSTGTPLGQPRTRPGLSAFQMATSPGGLNFSVNGRGANVAFAKGGLAQACSCLAEGGQPGPFVGFVAGGPGGGQDDLIEARLSPGEYVFDADTVSALGDGNNEEGARRLDAMREQVRAHKRAAPVDEIPPQAAAPEEYLSAAMQGGE